MDFFSYQPEAIMLLTLMFLILYGVHYTSQTFEEKGALAFPKFRNTLVKYVVGPNHIISLDWSIIWCFLTLLVFNTQIIENTILLNGIYIRSTFSMGLSKYLFLCTAICLLLSSFKKLVSEYSILLLLCSISMHLLIMCVDLMGLYLSMELQSFCLVILCSLNYKSVYSVEAGIKYFLLSALSSAVMVFGISLIYSFVGFTDCSTLFEALVPVELISPWLKGAVWLISLSLLWKLAAAPLHMWAADVYQGAMSSVTLFISTLPKLAVIGFWLNTWHYCPHAYTLGKEYPFLPVIAACCLLVGAFSALGQINLKRLLAFSSIAQMGFLLMPLCGHGGASATITHLSVYILTSIAIWGIILWTPRTPQFLWHWLTLSYTHPEISITLIVLLMSLSGLPPVAGFLGKLSVFFWSLNAHNYILVAIALISTFISTYYYLRIIRIAYTQKPYEWVHIYDSVPTSHAFTISVVTLFLFIVFWYSYPLLFYHEVLCTG